MDGDGGMEMKQDEKANWRRVQVSVTVRAILLVLGALLMQMVSVIICYGVCGKQRKQDGTIGDIQQLSSQSGALNLGLLSKCSDYGDMVWDFIPEIRLAGGTYGLPEGFLPQESVVHSRYWHRRVPFAVCALVNCGGDYPGGI